MPFPITTGYGSTAGIDFIHAERGRIALFAASDIFAGTPVTIQQTAIGSTTSTDQGFAVRMCASQNDEPLGIARDNAAAGGPVTVWDYGNIVRLVVNGSVNAAFQIGVINTSSAVHPISNVSVQYPVLGQVTAASWSNIVNAVGASSATFNAAWSVGQSFEPGNPGQGVPVRINPRLLSGLA